MLLIIVKIGKSDGSEVRGQRGYLVTTSLTVKDNYMYLYKQYLHYFKFMVQP